MSGGAAARERIQITKFAEAVSLPEAAPFLVHLDLGQRVERDLPSIARRFLAVSQSDRQPQPSLAEDVKVLAHLAAVAVPDHLERHLASLWTQRVFLRFADIEERVRPELSIAQARGVADAVAEWTATVGPIADELLRLDDAYEEREGHPDRFPLSGRLTMFEWRYYKSLWRALTTILSDDLEKFAAWARQASGYDGSHGELCLPENLVRRRSTKPG